MIPPFNEDGTLPPGIYTATLAEIKQRFATTPARRALFRGFRLLVTDLVSAGCRTLYLSQTPALMPGCFEEFSGGLNPRRTDLKDPALKGGVSFGQDDSFITVKEEPRDYDACWETEGVNNTISPILRDIKTFKDERKHKYGGDIFYLAPELGANFLKFFQSGRDGKPKGVIHIDLRIE